MMIWNIVSSVVILLGALGCSLGLFLMVMRLNLQRYETQAVLLDLLYAYRFYDLTDKEKMLQQIDQARQNASKMIDKKYPIVCFFKKYESCLVFPNIHDLKKRTFKDELG